MADNTEMSNDVRSLSGTEPVSPIDEVVPENDTVYASDRDLGVVQLESWLSAEGGKLPAEDALNLLIPLYNALTNIHGKGIIHRGLSPYTVYIDKSGRLYLWDFCLSAVRTGGSELEAERFDGYSAQEQ